MCAISVCLTPLYIFLLTPPHQSAPLPPETPAGWSCLKSFAASHEIAGPHERWYTWEGECAYVRGHYHNLRKAPRLSACDTLATYDQCAVMLEAIASQRALLEQEREGQAFTFRRERIQDQLRELARQESLWRLCQEAQSPQASWVSRRYALAELLRQP